MIVLMQTEFLPEPVAPAISRWGHLRDIEITTLPAISRPTAKEIFDSLSWNSETPPAPGRKPQPSACWEPDADCRLSGNRRLDSYIRRRQIQFDIIRQIDDLADLHTHLRLNLITGYRGPQLTSVTVTLTPKFFKICWSFAAVSCRVALNCPRPFWTRCM